MSEPDFYAEDLVLIERVSKAWRSVFDKTLAVTGDRVGNRASHAAHISLFAALHKRCEEAEARTESLEKTVAALQDQVNKNAVRSGGVVRLR